MARYLCLSRPRCNGYVDIVLREPGRNTALQEVNGHVCAVWLSVWVVGAGGEAIRNSQANSMLPAPRAFLLGLLSLSPLPLLPKPNCKEIFICKQSLQLFGNSMILYNLLV